MRASDGSRGSALAARIENASLRVRFADYEGKEPMRERNFHNGGSKTIAKSFVDQSQFGQDPELLMLWPTPVYLVRNTDLSGWHAALADGISKTNREFRADWHNSDFFSLKLNGVEGFADFLRQNLLKRIAREVENMDQLKVTWEWDGWVNALPGNSWHMPHIHERSTFSFVYYVQADTNIDRAKLIADTRKDDIQGGVLQFMDPRGAAPYMACQTVDTTYSSAVRIIPANGLLIIFPSFLAHLVAPIQSQDLRISISGNVFNIMAIP